MRRIVLAVAVFLMVTAGASQAAVDLVVAGPGSVLAGYSTPTVVVLRGQRTEFRNLDSARHDVVSTSRGRLACRGIRGRRLFCSATIDFGGNAPVRGVERLPTGDYAFYCSIHPTTMRGRLVVR